MRVAVFSSKPYDREFLAAANGAARHELVFLDVRLTQETAALASGFAAVSVFVNDRLDAATIGKLGAGGTRLIALRCAGTNNVDLAAADAAGIAVVCVPDYSPHAVAEFTIGLIISLERKIHRAWARVRENNFSLDGLVGRNLHGRTVAVVGTGRIGALVARTLKLGFGCRVLAVDMVEDAELKAIGVEYASANDAMAAAHLITFHCPLTPATRHMLDAAAIARAMPGLMVVNTSRGALVDTPALIDGLKRGQIGGVALDVYEEEAAIFFEDMSDEIVQDDVFQRLLTLPNVLVTGHQAFLTQEALTHIAEATLANIGAQEAGTPLKNRVRPATH